MNNRLLLYRLCIAALIFVNSYCFLAVNSSAHNNETPDNKGRVHVEQLSTEKKKQENHTLPIPDLTILRKVYELLNGRF